ncbi:MAG: porin family protein [Gemmatimonadota bacterium]|nr:porin family protein [Gemmatimonadota bacterium]MDH4348800.1 porin family protein [Gemmatimonadota bacterium]MDH5283352.1 porin family protein [Gemmatimonadota bacterium]
MRKALLVFALLGLVTSAATAQDESSRRSGFWLNVGFGWGSADFNCDGCDTDRESGVSGQFALGGTLSPQFLIGVESNGWYKDENSVESMLGTFAAVAYYYPSATGNLFVKGGLGFASYRFENGGSADDTGFGLLGGVGYDIPIGGKFSITPVATFQYGIMGDANGAEGVSQNILSLGATFTLH